MIVSRKLAEEARATLEMAPPLEQLDEAFIKTVYKLRAMEHHPDKGGDPAKFVEIDRAKHILLKWLEKAPDSPPKPHGGVTKCPRCSGVGYLELRRGFAAPLRKQCPTCQGNGETYDEREKDGDRL